MKRIITSIVLVLTAITLAACGTNAETASENISKEADQFKVGRRIVVTNSITDQTIYQIEGRCSFKVGDRRLDVICKNKPGSFTKATIGLGDNTTWASVQLGPIKVSEYRTKILFRPEAIVPDFDLVTGNESEKTQPIQPTP